MAYLKPGELLDNGSLSGHPFSDIEHMLEHYGFIPTYPGGGGSHAIFRHRDYKDLRLTVANHSGSVRIDTTRDCCKACLEVKRRNAERRNGEKLDAIPEWVSKSLPGHFAGEVEGGVLRVQAKPNGDSRRAYSIRCKKGSLEVTNLNYPEQFHFTFNIRPGDHAPSSGFCRLFEECDGQVIAHQRERETTFLTSLDRLEKNRGFTLRQDDPAMTGMPLLHIEHKPYHLAFAVPLHETGDTIATESIETLKTALDAHEEAYYRQIELLEAMGSKGWKHTQTAGAKGAGTITFTHPSGATFSLETSGELQSFDLDAACVAAHMPPVSGVGSGIIATSTAAGAAAQVIRAKQV